MVLGRLLKKKEAAKTSGPEGPSAVEALGASFAALQDEGYPSDGVARFRESMIEVGLTVRDVTDARMTDSRPNLCRLLMQTVIPDLRDEIGSRVNSLSAGTAGGGAHTHLRLMSEDSLGEISGLLGACCDTLGTLDEAELAQEARADTADALLHEVKAATEGSYGPVSELVGGLARALVLRKVLRALSCDQEAQTARLGADHLVEQLMPRIGDALTALDDRRGSGAVPEAIQLAGCIDSAIILISRHLGIEESQSGPVQVGRGMQARDPMAAMLFAPQMSKLVVHLFAATRQAALGRSSESAPFATLFSMIERHVRFTEGLAEGNSSEALEALSQTVGEQSLALANDLAFAIDRELNTDKPSPTVIQTLARVIKTLQVMTDRLGHHGEAQSIVSETLARFGSGHR